MTAPATMILRPFDAGRDFPAVIEVIHAAHRNAGMHRVRPDRQRRSLEPRR